MRSYQVQSENCKFWAFRKNHPKNIIFFREITKNSQLVHQNEKKSKSILSNLNFTKFSIYFKISQKKKKPLNEKISSFFLIGDKKNPMFQNRIKKNNLFSIYKKYYFVRLYLENFFFANTLYFKNIRKKQKFKQSLLTSFGVYHNFKRTLFRFKKETVTNEFREPKKKFNETLIYGIKVNKILTILSGIPNLDFFQKYNFLSKFLKFFRLNRIFFPNNETRIFSNYLKIHTTKLIDKKIKPNQSLPFSSNPAKFKNIILLKLKREKKMNFFCNISKFLSFVLTKKVTFFNFLLTYSYQNVWNLNLFDSNFEEPLGKKKMLKKKSICFGFLKSLEKNFVFLKESNFILNFISISVIPKLISKSIKNKIAKRTLFFNLRQETKELIKSLNFFKRNRALILSEKFFKIKKDFWIKGTIMLFWYIFLDYQPLFLVSFTMKKQLMEKIDLKLAKSYLNIYEPNKSLKFTEKSLNIKKKGKKNRYNQKLSNNFQSNKFISRKWENFTKFFEKKTFFDFNSKFPGFLSLKIIRKIRRIINYVKKSKKIKIEKKNRNHQPFLKKNESTITTKLKFFSQKAVEPQKRCNLVLIDKNKKLNFELIDRTGYVFLKEKCPIIFFLYLETTVKLLKNKKKTKINWKKKVMAPILRKRKPTVKLNNRRFDTGTTFLENFIINNTYSFLDKKLDKNIKILKNSFKYTDLKSEKNIKKLNNFKNINKEWVDHIFFDKLVQDLDLRKTSCYFQSIGLFGTKFLAFFQI